MLDAGVREFRSSRDPSQVYLVTFGRGASISGPAAGRRARRRGADLKPSARLLLINLADTQGRDNEDALSALRVVEGIEALLFAVMRRKAFPNAFSNGLSVIEHMPRDQKAVDELLSVVGALYTQEVGNDYSSGPQRKVG